MTLDEKAEEYTTNIVLNGRASIEAVTKAYMDGYRQSQLDTVAVIQWSAEKNELLEANEILKEQIEKMKCCINCKQYDNPKTIQVGFGEYKDICDFCRKNDKWELAE